MESNKPIELMSKDELITLQVELTKKSNEQSTNLDSVQTAQALIDRDLEMKEIERSKLTVEIKELEKKRGEWVTPIRKAKSNLARINADLKSVNHLIFKKD